MTNSQLRASFEVVLISLLLTMGAVAQPTIQSFSPASGNVGSPVVITGTNFSATLSSNIVYFGAVRATVTNASPGSLTVTVPAGASYEPLKVIVGGLAAYSNIPFIVTFPGGGAITAASFGGRTVMTGVNSPYDLSPGDIDGDGKADLVVVNGGFPYGVSVFRNISTAGNIAFEAKVDVASGFVPNHVQLADIEGDGRPDLIFSNSSSHNISIVRNFSNPGSLTFGTPVTFTTQTNPTDVAVADLDGDGHPEVICTNFASHTISIRRNLSSIGVISFDNRIDIAAGSFPRDLKVNDLDGDGKPDLSLVNDAQVSFFRNTSTTGIISFASPVGAPQGGIVQADVDGDGKVDLAVTNATGGVSLYRNISSSGAFTWAPRVDFPIASSTNALTATDLDGDGKADLAIGNNDSVAFLRNTSTAGNISFGAKFNALLTTNAGSLKTCDIDGDGRPELLATDPLANQFIILRNTIDAPNIVSFTPAGGIPGTQVTITGTNFTGVTQVQFGDQLAADFTIQSPTTIVATTGNGTTGKISATSPLGIGLLGDFTFFYPPSITEFSPTTGATSTTVTITGTNFTGATAVSFGGVPALSFNVVSATSITAVVGGGNSGDVQVITPYGTATGGGFTYVPPAPIPVITTFTPVSGSAETVVTISGSNFSGVPDNNVVYFGGARATVLSASSNSLQVRVPIGVTYKPITVTVEGSTAYSSKAFMPTFTGLSPSNQSAFEERKLSRGTYATNGAVVGDLDGDDKLDLAAFSNFGRISVFRNISNSGDVLFAEPLYFNTGGGSYDIKMADLNGDGKPDLAVSNDGATTISILVNTSSAGNISFELPFQLPVTSHPYSVDVNDIDGDGRVDIVVANTAVGIVSVYRNLTVNGALAFDSKKDYVTGKDPYYVAVGDLDGDGRPDIAAVNFSNATVATFRNTSIPGVISFAGKVDFPSPMFPIKISINDVNLDGKPELLVIASTLFDNYVSVYRNTGSAGTIAFDGCVNYVGGPAPDYVSAGDVDGDGKPELVVSNAGHSRVSVLKNQTSGGTIAFDPGVLWISSGAPREVYVGDIDGDGKPDITAPVMEGYISVLRNSTADPVVERSGSNPVFGAVAKRVTVDASVQTYGGSPYVQRHYDITPYTDPDNATATVTLYFTQQEFNNFNAHPAREAELPKHENHYNGKASLRIFQFHGTSTTGLPGSYTGDGVEIDPNDDNIVWDAVNNTWSVTFSVNGFSGFFVGAVGSNILPLTLLGFNGKIEGDNARLSWTTTDEVNIDHFELQRSTNGSDFKQVDKIAPKGGGTVVSNYSYVDVMEKGRINFYRLKIVDLDGKFKYSHVVALKTDVDNSKLSLYPNPAKGFVMVMHPAFTRQTQIQLIDGVGRIVKTQQLAPNVQATRLELTGLPKGTYRIVIRHMGSRYVQPVVIH